MKTRKMIRVITVFLLMFFALGIFSSCSITTTLNSGNGKSLQEYYDKVSDCQRRLDSLADAIYRNWYDAIYNDKFWSDIDIAVYSAKSDHEDDIKKIEELDEEIKSLFSKVKEGSASSQVKAVMSAYSDYYEFVVNVSGSFESYSKNKEELKKALASALKNLSYEI